MREGCRLLACMARLDYSGRSCKRHKLAACVVNWIHLLPKILHGSECTQGLHSGGIANVMYSYCFKMKCNYVYYLSTDFECIPCDYHHFRIFHFDLDIIPNLCNSLIWATTMLSSHIPTTKSQSISTPQHHHLIMFGLLPTKLGWVVFSVNSCTLFGKLQSRTGLA